MIKGRKLFITESLQSDGSATVLSKNMLFYCLLCFGHCIEILDSFKLSTSSWLRKYMSSNSCSLPFSWAKLRKKVYIRSYIRNSYRRKSAYIKREIILSLFTGKLSIIIHINRYLYTLYSWQRAILGTFSQKLLYQLIQNLPLIL
jgi:hypothetical protein